MDATQDLRIQEMNGRKRIAMDAIQAVQHEKQQKHDRLVFQLPT